MKNNLLFTALILLLTVGSSACKPGTPAAIPEGTDIFHQYTVEELKADYNQFRRIIKRKTARLYTDRDELEKDLHEAEKRIDRPMTELEFYRLLSPLVAALKCGHSFLSVSDNFEKHMRDNALFFPAQVRIIDEKLFVIADPKETGLEPGTEIVRINGKDTATIIDEIYASVPTDGRDTGRPRYDTERWFASFYYIYIGTPCDFSLEVRDPKTDRISTIEVPAVRDPVLAKTAQGVMHDTSNTPWDISFKREYAFLTIPTFSYSDKERYARFLQSVFAEIAERELQTLIVDLRGNYGGTPFPTAELFRYLIDEPLPFFAGENPFYLRRWKKPIDPAPEAFDGELFVLMDEAGFSMNGFLLSLLKYHDIGTLIGKTSSGGFKCSDASRNITLRNTGLRLRYSTAVFQTAVKGFEEGIGIEPDIQVQWSLDDYLNGYDPVFNAALEAAGIN